MRCKRNCLGGRGVFFLGAVFFGLVTLAGCEKPKPTVGDQIGSAIDDTINATGQATTNIEQSTKQLQDKMDQASKSISKETVDLRDAVKQAVDDHLSTDNGN